MEKEFIFLRLVEGHKKDGNTYRFMDYVNPNTYEPLRYWYTDNPNEFATLKKKIVKGMELKKLVGICQVDEHGYLIIVDIK